MAIQSVDLSGPISALGNLANVNASKAAQFYQAALQARQMKQQTAAGVGGGIGAGLGALGFLAGPEVGVPSTALGASLGSQAGGATQGAPVNAGQVINDAAQGYGLGQSISSNNMLKSMLTPQTNPSPTDLAGAGAYSAPGQGGGGSLVGSGAYGAPTQSVMGIPVPPGTPPGMLYSLTKNPGALGALQFLRMQNMMGGGGMGGTYIKNTPQADGTLPIPGLPKDATVERTVNYDDKGQPRITSRVIPPSELIGGTRKVAITDPWGNSRDVTQNQNLASGKWETDPAMLEKDSDGQPKAGMDESGLPHYNWRAGGVPLSSDRLNLSINNLRSEIQASPINQKYSASQNAYQNMMASEQSVDSANAALNQLPDTQRQNTADPHTSKLMEARGLAQKAYVDNFVHMINPTLGNMDIQDHRELLSALPVEAKVKQYMNSILNGIPVTDGQMQMMKQVASREMASKIDSARRLATNAEESGLQQGLFPNLAATFRKSIDIDPKVEEHVFTHHPDKQLIDTSKDAPEVSDSRLQKAPLGSYVLYHGHVVYVRKLENKRDYLPIEGLGD